MSRLGDRLRLHARDAADAPAVHAGDRWWSFGELAAAAESLALPAGPGDVVAIAVDRGIEAVLAVCATALASAIPALIDPHDRELAARRLAGLRPTAVLAAADDADLPGARVIARPGAPAHAATAAGWDPVRRTEPIAHILFTSGSTADGKGVVWSELRAGYDWMLSPPPRIARGRPAGIVVPLCTSLGYHELTRALYHGTSVALLDAPFPAAIAQARELGVDRIRLTPTHVELLLATAEELPALRIVSVTAAPIEPDRLRALAERLPSARIARSYGLTESGAATVVWRHRKPGKLHTVGRAVGFRRVTVRDDTGRMLPPGEAGEVVIDLPVWHACDGYLDAPPELARRFANATLWTGDRGTIDEHGFLVLGARAAEILKVGGRSVGAPRIEEVLAALPGIAEVAVVGVPDRVLGEVPCAVFVPAAGGDPHRLADHAAAAEVRPDELPRWLLARRELPRGPSGKLRRGLLAEEAARWARSFGRAIVADHRRYPAFDLESGIAIVDGCPRSWIADTAGLDPAARMIALVARRPLHPLALAIVQAGATETGDDVRFVVGPVAVALAGDQVTDDLLDVFAGELIVLAGALPGPRPALTCACSPAPRGAFTGAGFAAIPGHPGWMRRPQGEAVPAVSDAALRELAAAATRLTECVRRGGAREA
jgi:acyl-coenzyme A synthetase/AMP-(fatty) acid ligase